MSDRPVFVSFYAGDRFYRDGAVRLQRRCAALGIPILIERLDGAGEYWTNTLRKPPFILEKARELRTDLFWIDVDTLLNEDHDCFKAVSGDLTFASHTGTLQGIKASPIGVKYNDASLQFLSCWSEVCLARLGRHDVDLDHDILKYEVMPHFCGRVSVRIMTDGVSPRNFTDGRYISNGLSRVHGKSRALQAVMSRNARRAQTFNALGLHHFR
jgi:hypothetical protein